MGAPVLWLSDKSPTSCVSKRQISRLSVMDAGQCPFWVGARPESNGPRDYILGFDPLVSLLRRRCRHRHGPPYYPSRFMGARLNSGVRSALFACSGCC